MRRRPLIAAAAVVVALDGCGSNERFSREEVEHAFARQGVQLVTADKRFDGAQEAILSPRAGATFVVLVYKRDADATRGLQALRSQRTAESFDRREANVVITADEGVAAATRIRIERALRTLRSSG
jgi:hypothetical protein